MDNEGIEFIKDLLAELVINIEELGPCELLNNVDECCVCGWIKLREKIEDYLSGLEKQKITPNEAWEKLIGNEHVKRAIEVSLAGQHPITVIGNPDNGEEYLERILGDLLTFIPPCKCYHFTDPFHACICGVSELNKYRNSKKYKKAMTNEILVQLFPPTKHDITNQNSESFIAVMKRIENISSITPRFYNSELLKVAISRIGFSLVAIEAIKRVAVTIAKLDNSIEVKEYHIAEAIQYQNLNNY